MDAWSDDCRATRDECREPRGELPGLEVALVCLVGLRFPEVCREAHLGESLACRVECQDWVERLGELAWGERLDGWLAWVGCWGVGLDLVGWLKETRVEDDSSTALLRKRAARLAGG